MNDVGRRQRHLLIDVGVGLREGDAVRLEVREREHRHPVRTGVPECPQHGMAFAHAQLAARAEEIGHRRGPPLDTREPAERPDAGVHEIEPAPAEHVGGVVDVGFDVLDVRPTGRGHAARLDERAAAEVESGHVRSEPSQRQRVVPHVALQMDHVEAGDIAEPLTVELHRLADQVRFRRCTERVDIRRWRRGPEPATPSSHG